MWKCGNVRMQKCKSSKFGIVIQPGQDLLVEFSISTFSHFHIFGAIHRLNMPIQHF